MKRADTTKITKAPIWIEGDHRRALEYLARETGDPNMTGFVRRHIESEIRDRLGPNWRERIDKPEMAVAS